MSALTTAAYIEAHSRRICLTGDSGSAKCWLAPAYHRPRNTRSVPLASAAADKEPSASSNLNSRNTDQIDQLLAGLSELRTRQQQGLVTDTDEDEEWDEFEGGQEGVDWVWWRTADLKPSVSDQAAAESSPVSQTSAIRSQQEHHQHARQQEQQQQQEARTQQQQQKQPTRRRRSRKSVAVEQDPPERSAKEYPVTTASDGESNNNTHGSSSSASSSTRRRRTSST